MARLDPDTERAGAAYEALRRALIAFFAWRGAGTPDELADEVLDRLAARLGEGVAVENVPRFARGIARLVLLEYWRRPDARPGSLDDGGVTHPFAADPPEDVLHGCLERCLSELPREGRELILGYYGAHGRLRIEGRKRLAAAVGASETALRNRAQRLRDRLERCVLGCVGRPQAPSATKG
jgi:DNA-directed RNA polymerase specialized sigma24 family protein